MQAELLFSCWNSALAHRRTGLARGALSANGRTMESLDLSRNSLPGRVTPYRPHSRHRYEVFGPHTGRDGLEEEC